MRRPVLLAPRFASNRLWLAAREVPSWHIAPARTGNVRDLVAGADLVTFSNSSPAWGFNSSGVLVQPAANVPFIEYDPATGSALGWRVWEAVTNLGLHSRDLTQTSWVKSGITPTRDQIGADGTANTATRLTATASDGTALQTITSASATRVSGFLIKRITGTGVIQITQDGGATWNTVTITNQWLRYSIAAATVTNPQFGFRVRSSGDEIAVDFAQVQSSSILGPPVVTTSLTASSTADVASITGSAFAGIWNPNEATLFADVVTASTKANQTISINDGSQSNRMEIRPVGANADVLRSDVVVAGTVQSRTITIGSQSRRIAALAMKANEFRIQSGSISSDIPGSAMPVVDRMYLNYATFPNGELIGYISELAIWKSRRPNSNLTAMTQ